MMKRKERDGRERRKVRKGTRLMEGDRDRRGREERKSQVRGMRGKGK